MFFEDRQSQTNKEVYVGLLKETALFKFEVDLTEEL